MEKFSYQRGMANLKSLLTLVTSFVFLFGTAQAGSLFKADGDPFNGTSGQTIMAYDADYTQTNPAQTVYNTLQSPGLTYTDGSNTLLTSGLSANIGGSNTSYQGAITSKWTNGADFTDVASEQEMFFSFLLNIPQMSDLLSGGMLGLQFILGTSRDIKVGVGNNGGTFYLGGNRNSNAVNSGFNVTSLIGSTIFVVGQIPAIPTSGYTNPVISLYLNPADLTTQPGAASATFLGGNTNTGVNLTEISLLSIKAGGNNQRSFGYIDEVRFGTTWEDVVPLVPEPSSFALLTGLLIVGWVFVRRRRS
jgi:hypothetical protein